MDANQETLACATAQSDSASMCKQSSRHLSTTTQLAVWVLSGNSAKAAAFQEQLQSLYCPRGEKNHQNPTTLSLGNGLAGALNGTEIPFQDL